MRAIERIIIVVRSTELDDLVARFNTVPQARFYIEQSGQNFERIEIAHKDYKEAVSSVMRSLPTDLKHQVLDRSLVSRFLFNSADIIVVIGQDGLVSNTAKYLDDQVIIGVNPSPDLFDGILLPYTAKTTSVAISQYIAGALTVKTVTLAEAKTNDGQTLLAFNDFFIGANSHVSARYEIVHGHDHEAQSSSGIIVSTGAGSTGWLKSIHQGAVNVAAAFGGVTGSKAITPTYAWDHDELIFAVREPFPSRITGTAIGYGKITRETPLKIISRMATNGVIFSDGLEADYIAFNAGCEAEIKLAKKKAFLAIPT